MGMLEKFRPSRNEIVQARTALEEAREGRPDGGAIDRLVRMVMSVGIDGKGPFRSATAVAERALAQADGNTEKAVHAVTSSAIRWGAVGGFATGLGGFVTMPVALPANLLEFYVQATRMVAAVATLRGYDISRPEVRTAVMLTLVRSDAEDVLAKAGIPTATGRMASFALKRLPASALMLVNKAIGFRLLRGVGERFLTRLGRGLPFVGGIVGGMLDAWMMHLIGAAARRQLPPH
ncbi:EcsC family protein [Pseudactinotalea suaedae]|uniref:EcsC family protein n=1 Tax=Pseudactinotalea suaedae TaxID=1524924 RepID=UPI0019D5F5A3|nr:EcsC family protein [Pseudactinotalea suaedae]